MASSQASSTTARAWACWHVLHAQPPLRLPEPFPELSRNIHPLAHSSVYATRCCSLAETLAEKLGNLEAALQEQQVGGSLLLRPLSRPAAEHHCTPTLSACHFRSNSPIQSPTPPTSPHHTKPPPAHPRQVDTTGIECQLRRIRRRLQAVGSAVMQARGEEPLTEPGDSDFDDD